MVDYSNNFNGYVNNNINGSSGFAYAPENNNFQVNNGDYQTNPILNRSLPTNSNNRFQNTGAKLNSIQNMFFNNNTKAINLPNNNNIFSNQPINNVMGFDTGYLDYHDLNNPNFQGHVNNNSNHNANINQFNPEMNYDLNANGNLNNNYNANNNTNDAVDLENLKKKTFMDGIQQQIQSNKNSKLQELIKKKMEDQKYLSDMNTYNPFGRNGAGAPLRDNSGKIITKRRALISDNKKLNDSIGNIKDDSINAGNPNAGGNNMNLNNVITNLTQKISAYGTENIGVNNIPRYNSARVAPPNQPQMIRPQILNPQSMNTMYNPVNSNLNNFPNLNNTFNQNPYQDNFLMNNNNNNNQIPNFSNNGYMNNNNYAPMNNNNPYNNNQNYAQNYIPNGMQNNNPFMMENNMNYGSNTNMIPNSNSVNGDGLISNPLNFNNYPINNNNPALPQNLNNSYASSGLQNNLNNNPLQLNNANNQSGNLFDNIGADDKKKIPNEEYKKSLLEQIEIRRMKKEEEKKNKKVTELVEEERIKKELEVIRERYDEEVNGKKKKIKEAQDKNIKMLENFLKEDEKEKKTLVASKRKGKIIDFEPASNNNLNNSGNQNENKSFAEESKFFNLNEIQNPNLNNNNNNFPPSNAIPSTFFNPLAPEFNPNNQFNPYNNNNYPYNQIPFNNQNPNNNMANNNQNIELERDALGKKITEEIQLLKNTFMDNQNNLMRRIEELKIESSTANQQNSETVKELTKLKQELENIRKDEEYRRKHVYDVLLDKTLKYNEIMKNSRLPPGDEFEFLKEEDKDEYKYERSDAQSVTQDNVSVYANNLKRDLLNGYNMLNRTRMSNLYGKTNHEMNATTKFIDMQTKEVYNNLDEHPNNKLNKAGGSYVDDYNENKLGIKIDNDLASLKSYYNKIDRKNENLFNELEKKNLEDINNLNLNLSSHIERIRPNNAYKQNDNYSVSNSSYNKYNQNELYNEKVIEFDNFYKNNEDANRNNFNAYNNNRHLNENNNYFYIDNADNVSGISEIKNNFNFNLENININDNNINNHSGNLTNKGNQAKNLKNPYANYNNTLSSRRKFNETNNDLNNVNNNNNYNDDNDNFTVNKILDKNAHRLRNLEQYENQGY